MMIILPLNRSVHRHTHGPQKGMITIEHWYPREPHVRYSTCVSTKAWDCMAVAVRQDFEFRMRVDANEALTGAKQRKEKQR